MTATLEFIIGRAGTGKTTACLEAMRQRMAEDPLGPALILLLPEHMTFRVERQLAGLMAEQGQGFLRSYVFGFRRFARQILLETGGAVLPRISELGRRLLLKRILHRRQKELTVFARAAGRHGFSQELGDALDEAKSYGITPEILRQKAGELERKDPYLAGKLQDIALLAADFTQTLAGRAADAGDALDTLVTRIPDSALLREAEVWVDGFVFFNPQEKAVLAALLAKVKAVHVTLSLDPVEGSPANGGKSGLFARSALTQQALKKLAQELGITPTVRVLTQAGLPALAGEKAAQHYGAPRFRAPALGQIERGLFSPGAMPQEAAAGLRIVEAATPRLEMTAMAADILRLCRERGFAWRDIGVLVRDDGDYAEQLRLLLPAYGIPYFIDAKRASQQHPLAELLRSVFEAIRSWRIEPLCRCLRTGFWTQLSMDNIDLLENYVREFGVRGRKAWTQEEPWSWRRYYSLEQDGELQEAAEQRLRDVEQWRRIVAEPLAKLQEELRTAANVRAQTEALYHFLLALEVPDTLALWAEREEQAAEAAGEVQQALAAEHRQLWNGLMELFDQLVTVSGEEKMPLTEYALVLSEGLDALQLSLIPQGLDAVTIAPFDQNSLQGCRAIYILGANAGVMPRAVSESGLLTDADRLHLQEVNLEIPSGGQERSFSENYLLYRGFTEARDYLWVSCPLADAQGGELLPSPLLHRLRTLLPRAEFLTLPLAGIDRTDDLQLAAPLPALNDLTLALRAQRDGRAMAPWWQDVYNWYQQDKKRRAAAKRSLAGLFAPPRERELPPELAQALFAPRRRLTGSVTRFECYRACPFHYFAQYGLKLKEREEYSFQHVDFGQLLHGVLHEFGEELRRAGRRWAEVDDKECAAMCQRALTELAPRVRGRLMQREAAYRHLLTRIQETAEHCLHRLIAYDKASRFHPAYLEQAFGPGEGKLPPLVYPIDGVKVELTGQIDRIDIADDGRYFLIIDYKTGHAALNLLEVWYGLRMQLLAYLLVARNFLSRDGKACLPAGVLYAYLKYSLLPTGRKEDAGKVKAELDKLMRMPGWVLADPAVIEAIDAEQHFIKASLNRDGSLSKATLTSVKTEEQFALLLDYMDYLIRDTGRRLLAGHIPVSPYAEDAQKNACTFCPYRDFCGFDPQCESWRILEQADDEQEYYRDMRAKVGGEVPLPARTGAGKRDGQGKEEEKA